MVLPTGVYNTGIKKKKQAEAAAAVGGPAGGGVVVGEEPDIGPARTEPAASTTQQDGFGLDSDRSRSMANQTLQGAKDLPSETASGKTLAPPSAVGGGAPPPGDDDAAGGDGFHDPNQSVSPEQLAEQEIDESSLDELAYLRALGLMGGGNPVTEEQLANTRAAANRAGADEVRRMRAMFGGSGFGASGLAGGAISDAATSAALQTEQAVMDLEAAGRQEQLQNILAGAQLGQTQRGSRVDAERNRMIMDLLRDEYLDEEPYSSGGDFVPEDVYDLSAGDDGFAQRMKDEAHLRAMEARGDAGGLLPALGMAAQDLYRQFAGGGKFDAGSTGSMNDVLSAGGVKIGEAGGMYVYRMPEGHDPEYMYVYPDAPADSRFNNTPPAE